MFLEIGDTCYTLFNMVIYETNDKEKGKKRKYLLFISYLLSLVIAHLGNEETLDPQFLEKVSKIIPKIKSF